MKKKFLSLVLCLCVVFALLPMGAGAVDYPGFDMADYQKYLEEAMKESGMDMPDLSDFAGFNMEDWQKQVEDLMAYEELLEQTEKEEEAREAAAAQAAAEKAAQEAAQAAAGPEVITIQAPRTVEELNVKWSKLKPVHTSGSPYVTEPEMSYEKGGPTLGVVKEQVLVDGLNTLNFARYMAGLTGDVSLVRDFIISAQYGSALLAYRGMDLTHTPEMPQFLDDKSFYEKGYEGTTNSSIHKDTDIRRVSQGVVESVKGYLGDLGENNRDAAGHRDSALDPSLTGTGFGLATSRFNEYFSAMWTGYGSSLNGTGTKTTDYEAITWPVAGYHAMDFYKTGIQWSVRVNSSRYDTSKLGEVKVTVTGPNGTAVVPHKIGPYSHMIIFTPTQSVRAGEKYSVEVSGLYRNNKPATLKYTVEFFDLRAPGTSTADRLAVDKIAVEEGVKEFSYVATNFTTADDLLKCLWAETKYVDSIQWVAAPAVSNATYSKNGALTGTVKLTLNGESVTYAVNMTIPKLTAGNGAYKALAAGKAMTVSASTTQAEVERHINAALPSGCTATVSRFGVVAPTATEIGYVYYDLAVSETGEVIPSTATIVQIIPVVGRKALDPQYLTTPAGTASSPAALSIPATGTAYPSIQFVQVDGVTRQFFMYALKDASGNPTNYVKVRDLADALNETTARFSVEWNGAVNLVAGKEYTPNGSENQIPFYGEKTYTVPTAPTNVNGEASDLVAITLYDNKGGGYTYYQLRDLGRKLGFNVGWSVEKGVYIETNKPYSGN